MFRHAPFSLRDLNLSVAAWANLDLPVRAHAHADHGIVIQSRVSTGIIRRLPHQSAPPNPRLYTASSA
jgi:hypothetical protein